MGDNPYKKEAQRVKAERLAAVFFKQARDLLFDLDAHGGGKPRGAKECAKTIMEMVNEASPELWVNLADAWGIGGREPSSEVQAMAKGLVLRRCDFLRKGGADDPFSGFTS